MTNEVFQRHDLLDALQRTLRGKQDLFWGLEAEPPQKKGPGVVPAAFLLLIPAGRQACELADRTQTASALLVGLAGFSVMEFLLASR